MRLHVTWNAFSRLAIRSWDKTPDIVGEIFGKESVREILDYVAAHSLPEIVPHPDGEISHAWIER